MVGSNFVNVTGSATVQNCYYADGTVIGKNNVGGVVGQNSVSSGVSGNATVQYCYATGNVTGDQTVGGVAGVNKVLTGNGTATVENCYYAIRTVKGRLYVGGIAGFNNGANSMVQNCYTTSAVSGDEMVCGVVGYLDAGTIKDCVALNSSLSHVFSDSIGRIGYGTGTSYNNNYGKEPMEKTIGAWSPAASTGNRTGGNVSNIEAKTKTWWMAYMTSWIFTPSSGDWEWYGTDTNGLPILQGVGGTQTPTL